MTGNWRLDRDGDGVAWLYFDKADSSTNTLSTEVLDELVAMMNELSAAPPAGLVILSAKQNGFIAGADIDGFTALKTVDDATALVKRGWDTYNQLAALPFPTLALIKGFCLGGGLELALACRYRVVVDDPGTRLGLPEVMLGIVPGWGGIRRLPRLIGAPAALDMLLTGKTDRRAPREEAGPRRRMRPRARHDERRARRAARRAAAARAAVSSVADAELGGAPRHRRAGAQAGRGSEPGRSTIRRPMRSSICG